MTDPTAMGPTTTATMRASGSTNIGLSIRRPARSTSAGMDGGVNIGAAVVRTLASFVGPASPCLRSSRSTSYVTNGGGGPCGFPSTQTSSACTPPIPTPSGCPT